LFGKYSFSEQTVRRIISIMELSRIVQDVEVLWLKSATTELAEHLLKTIQFKQLPDAISDATIKVIFHPNCKGKIKNNNDL
jgi:hypothetical protein